MNFCPEPNGSTCKGMPLVDQQRIVSNIGRVDVRELPITRYNLERTNKLIVLSYLSKFIYTEYLEI